MADFRYHADDLGYSPSSVAAVEELLTSGTLMGVSLLVNLPGFRRAVLLLRTHPIPAALHVNLVEGVPVSPRGEISSLVDSQGRFFPLPVFLLRLLLGIINKKDVELEVAAQLSKARQEGIAIVGLDSHRHTHMFSPVAEIFVKLSRRYAFSNTRSYGNFQTFTFFGSCKKLFVRLVAFLTHSLYFSQLSLPSSWKSDGSHRFLCFRSWESIALWRIKNKKGLRVVIHPGLPYDKG